MTAMQILHYLGMGLAYVVGFIVAEKAGKWLYAWTKARGLDYRYRLRYGRPDFVTKLQLVVHLLLLIALLLFGLIAAGWLIVEILIPAFRGL